MISHSQTPTKLPTVFVTPQGSIGLTEISNLVLSPHFYWVQRSQTPFGSITQARRIAPSLFEADTQEGSYHYEVYQNRDGEMIFIAFDPKAITRQLKALDIDFRLIKNVYLAQQLCDTMPQPLSYSDGDALALHEGVVVSVKQAYLAQDSVPIKTYLNQLALNAKKVPIEGTGSFDFLAYKKQLIVAVALTALILIGDFVAISNTASQLEAKEQQIKEQYKLPQTSFQRKSIASKLKRIEKVQSFIREGIYTLSKPQNRQQIAGRLESISASSNALDLRFAQPDAALKQWVTKLYPKAKTSDGKELLIVKVEP